MVTDLTNLLFSVQLYSVYLQSQCPTVTYPPVVQANNQIMVLVQISTSDLVLCEVIRNIRQPEIYGKHWRQVVYRVFEQNCSAPHLYMHLSKAVILDTEVHTGFESRPGIFLNKHLAPGQNSDFRTKIFVPYSLEVLFSVPG